jgi:hypothetical protein
MSATRLSVRRSTRAVFLTLVASWTDKPGDRAATGDLAKID